MSVKGGRGARRWRGLGTWRRWVGRSTWALCRPLAPVAQPAAECSSSCPEAGVAPGCLGRLNVASHFVAALFARQHPHGLAESLGRAVLSGRVVILEPHGDQDGGPHERDCCIDQAASTHGTSRYVWASCTFR